MAVAAVRAHYGGCLRLAMQMHALTVAMHGSAADGAAAALAAIPTRRRRRAFCDARSLLAGRLRPRLRAAE